MLKASLEKKLKSVFYNAVGPTLSWWRVDTNTASLSCEGSVVLPAAVQYAWQNPNLNVLYVATSNFILFKDPGDKHYLSAFHVDPKTGALTPFGEHVRIKSRPISITVDKEGKWLLSAYSVPSGITVHTINADGSIGPEIKPKEELDCGIFPHQVRVFPSNNSVILVTRGHNAEGEKPEEPGAFKVKNIKDGYLSDLASIATNGGYGFGPRHIDFHPTKPWMYASLERQQLLQMWRVKGDSLESQPAFSVSCLEDPTHMRQGQMLGPIRVHPNGNHVYTANRMYKWVNFKGKEVVADGENSIVVFNIDPMTGEPKKVQTVDPHGFHVRCLSIDPRGRMMVVGNVAEVFVREKDEVRFQPTTISTYHILDNGELKHANTYKIKTNGLMQWWSGFMTWNTKE